MANTEFLNEMDKIGRRIDRLNQETIAYHQRKLDDLAAWYRTPLPNTENNQQTVQVEEPKIFSAQDIYKASQQGGEQWEAVMKEIKQQWM